MPRVTIVKTDIVECDGSICHPLDLWKTEDECGNCPLFAFGRKWIDITFEDRFF